MNQSAEKKLVPHDYYSFALVIGISSSMQMLWSISDLWVVGQLSVKFIAALGLVDAVFPIISAMAYGIIDIHASQVANAEGRRAFTKDYFSLFLAASCVIVLSWLPVMIGSLVFGPVLTSLGQPVDVVTIGASNLETRAQVYLLSIFYVIIPLAIRIRGYRKFALGLLAVSFAIKMALNFKINVLFPEMIMLHLEKAVVYTTALAQIFTIVVGGTFLFVRNVQACPQSLNTNMVKVTIRDLLEHTPKIAAWNLNDFASSSLVVLVLGGFGVNYLAAINVASKITSLFYRLPQALSEAALVFYGYIAEAAISDRKLRAKTALQYTCLPVLVVSAIIFVSAASLIRMLAPTFSGAALDIAIFMIKVHMMLTIFYVFQHVCSQFLIVERETRFLLVSSLISTWVFVVPGVMLMVHYGLDGDAVILYERCFIVVMGLVNLVYFYKVLTTRPTVDIKLSTVSEGV